MTGTCEVCGNEYDKAFKVLIGDRSHTFDSFECAIHKLAPKCENCGCMVMGHGIEAGGKFYCCANCSRESGVKGAKDRVA